MNQEPFKDQNYYENQARLYREEKKGRKRKNKSTIVLALVCSLIGGGIGSSLTYRAMAPEVRQEVPQTGKGQRLEINTQDTASVGQAVAAKSMDSVVGITTESVQNTFFGPMAVQGSGSGFIVDAKGYIVTNAHVVANRSKETVTTLFNDGSQKQGKVLWEDANLDLAVIKVDTDKALTPVDLGNSDKIQIGEPAVAIGNPLGLDLQRSVTMGIISGLNRTVGSDQGSYIDGLIQTDASINAGNSGGPLFNSKGEVIGINTAKISSAEGLGFSIPINTLKPIVDQIIKTGTYETVSLGVVVANPSDVQDRYRVRVKVDKGAVVMDLYPNGTAAKAGLQQGDVITKIGDKEIKDTSSLKKSLYAYKLGDQAKVTYIRDGKEKEGTLNFQELASSAKQGQENFKEKFSNPRRQFLPDDEESIFGE